jgi:VWFA-related protein
MLVRFLALFLSILLCARGQAPAPPAPAGTGTVLRISVTLVQVDAVVTDRGGRQVTDLTADDFEVYQDGKKQKITHFSYVSTGPAPAAAAQSVSLPKGAPPVPAVRLRPEQVRRTLALVVDDLGLSFESMAQVRQALKKFVEEQMQPGDLAAVIRTGAGMGAFQQFTSDKRLLNAAIERVRWNALGRGGVHAFAPIREDPLESAETDDTRSREDIDQFRTEYFSVGTLGALNFIVRGLRELPGRKSVVLFSDNLRIFNREGYSDRVLDSLRQLTDLANRSSVVIYTIDSRGLPTLGLTAADNVSHLSPGSLLTKLQDRHTEYFESQDGLNFLAEQTGGLFFYGSNDLAGGIRRVLEDQKGYYLIGYTPDESTFKSEKPERIYHSIKVKVLRSGLHVRSRNGFFGVPDTETRPVYKNRDEQLFAALASPFGSGGVRLRLTSLFTNNLRSGSFLHSMLYIDARDLSYVKETDGRYKAAIDILLITFGENGNEEDRSYRTYTIRMSEEDYKNALERGFVYTVNHPVKKGGAYQLRAAVRDTAKETVGSASQFVEVPDVSKGKLALSGIFVRALNPAPGGQTPGGPVMGTTEGRAAEADPQGNPAVRVFHRGRPMVYAYQILNPQLDRATKQPQVETQLRLFRNGQQIFAGKPFLVDVEQQPDAKRMIAGGRLQIGAKMEAGEYVLQVIATDKLAKDKYRTATQSIDFEIVN